MDERADVSPAKHSASRTSIDGRRDRTHASPYRAGAFARQLACYAVLQYVVVCSFALWRRRDLKGVCKFDVNIEPVVEASQALVVHVKDEDPRAYLDPWRYFSRRWPSGHWDPHTQDQYEDSVQHFVCTHVRYPASDWPSISIGWVPLHGTQGFRYPRSRAERRTLSRGVSRAVISPDQRVEGRDARERLVHARRFGGESVARLK